MLPKLKQGKVQLHQFATYTQETWHNEEQFLQKPQLNQNGKHFQSLLGTAALHQAAGSTEPTTFLYSHSWFLHATPSAAGSRSDMSHSNLQPASCFTAPSINPWPWKTRCPAASHTRCALELAVHSAAAVPSAGAHLRAKGELFCRPS